MIKSIILVAISIAVFVGLFLALRNFFAWYHKTNELIKQNKQIINQNSTIIALLKVISEK